MHKEGKDRLILNITEDDYFCLFGEGDAELQEDDDDEERELQLESEQGDLLRYLLLSLPLAGGLGGGVGSVHGAVLSSDVRPQCCSVAALAERTLSADGLISDLVLCCSERCCITHFAA